MLKRRVTVLSVVLAAVLVVGNAGCVAAASTEDVSALKEQVVQLQAKVAQLEQRLGEKQEAHKKAPCPMLMMNEDSMDPFDEMAAMDRQMQGMMAGFGMPMRSMMKAHAATFAPDYDVKSTDKSYVISFDMPGMDKSKINVEVKNGSLLVSGERSSESKEDQGGKFYRQERSFGYFSRAIPLPQDVKPETVAAKYENGVLNITIDKKEADKQVPAKQKIEVK